jgi:hypothetical protein
VLFVHPCLVVFALLGLGLIVAGNLRSWRFVTAWWIRPVVLWLAGLLERHSFTLVRSRLRASLESPS